MKNILFLMKTSRSILLASVMFGIAGIVQAQSASGTGSASGAGRDSSMSGGTLTGPGSDSPQGGPGSATGRTLTGPGSDSPQGGPASRQGMTGKKGSSTDSSKKQGSDSTGY